MMKKYGRWLLIARYVALIGLAALGLWIVVKALLLFPDYIARSNPTVGAAIIATSGTILISVFTLVWNRRSERQKEIEQRRHEIELELRERQHEKELELQERQKEIEQRRHEIELELREKKLPIYGELVAFFFKLFKVSKAQTPLTPEEVQEFFVSLTEKTVIWGSDEFIAAFSKFRDDAVAQAGNNQQSNTIEMMKNFENLLYVIRRDYGHENKGLGPGDLLALFITDIRKYIEKQKP